MAIRPQNPIPKYARSYQVTRNGNLRKLPLTTPGAIGFTSEPAPDTQHSLEIMIDVEALIKQLGGRAIDSKSKRATVASGAIVVKCFR